MRGFRALSANRRRLLLIAALTALFVRSLVPEGWMPALAGSGAGLMLCDGTSHAMAAMPGMAGPHDKAPAGHGQGDHPCAFAGPSAAPDVPHLALPLRIAATAAVAPDIARPTSPGRGLAAPPPPATGPPLLA